MKHQSQLSAASLLWHLNEKDQNPQHCDPKLQHVDKPTVWPEKRTFALSVPISIFRYFSVFPNPRILLFVHHLMPLNFWLKKHYVVWSVKNSASLTENLESLIVLLPFLYLLSENVNAALCFPPVMVIALEHDGGSHDIDHQSNSTDSSEAVVHIEIAHLRNVPTLRQNIYKCLKRERCIPNNTQGQKLNSIF